MFYKKRIEALEQRVADLEKRVVILTDNAQNFINEVNTLKDLFDKMEHRVNAKQEQVIQTNTKTQPVHAKPKAYKPCKKNGKEKANTAE